MRVASDCSSIMWNCLLAGKDMEGIEVEHFGKKVWVNTCAYGYELAVNALNGALFAANATPQDLIMVFEGRDSKKRRAIIDPTYKANREGEKDSRPPEAYVQFNLLKEKLWDTYRKLGAIRLSQPFVEGDDVLAWLAENSEQDLMIHTNDNDMIVLHGKNKYGADIVCRIGGNIGMNKYGGFDMKLVTLYKALVGDSSDNIKGVPGFGEKAWFALNTQYDDDGCFELAELIVTSNKSKLEKIALDNNCKLLLKIFENFDAAHKCYRLAQLHPEWVNTVRVQPEWEVGMVAGDTKDERLKSWQGQVRLVTAANYDKALAFLQEKMAVTTEPAFDIETSTPEESDDWLDAQGGGVDVIGSYLCGFSITFGDNMQYTYYVSVKHADSDNVTMAQARAMIEAMFGKRVAIQNTNFELVVLYNDTAKDEDGTLWRDAWADRGERGFIPNVLDTKIEAMYVNENVKSGLKDRSRLHLNYAQDSYQKTMTVLFTDRTDLEGDFTVVRGSKWAGGKVLRKDEDATLVHYKMHEVPASHVLSYGADDTICTAALHNFYKLHMQLDHHYQVYLDVEIAPCYLHALSFYKGINVSIARSKELEAKDQKVSDEAWKTLRTYLIEKGWAGTIPPSYTKDMTCADIKEAYKIVMGINEVEPDEEDDEDAPAEPVEAVKDNVLSSRIRTPVKLAALIEAEGHDLFSKLLNDALGGSVEPFNAYVLRHFSGEPAWKISNKNMVHLMYTVMGLPIKVRGKATAIMKSKGIFEGNPKGDTLAIAYALQDCKEAEKPVLEAIKLMQMVKTRMGLYYKPYPNFVHWKTGKVHSSHNQSATNTRRASSSKPNIQQLPKTEKIEGEKPEFRSVITPHKKGAVIVSMDFVAQELRLIADYSQDEMLLSCYVGDNLKDVHSLTGLSIAKKKEPSIDWSYDSFIEAVEDKTKPLYAKAKSYRGKGKTVNFATEFGAQADKLAATMMISKEDAQLFIDLREATFPRVKAWKEEVVEEAREFGQVRTKLGAVRHLKELLNSDDRFIASKAERQAVNYEVQASAGEQTKKAEGRMWEQGLFTDFDASYIGPIHDECVASFMVEDLAVLLPMMHKCMVDDYADMKVPIRSSIGVGHNFADLHEIGDVPSAEVIAAILPELAKV